ncbi:lymphocyte cytosolic protein 2a isoform X2 [Brachyhypopomus gauderio]|uniref:lymphocyte cytosolic protein 2a isoform X2 n=1 Tax=Brachyhypopomus gauderio TaxID=698409 RepID=UPI0040436607
MSFDSIPSKKEVMSWDPQHMADFLKRRDLTGCDKVIIKHNMNGPRFLNMSDNDLQKFPKLHAPLISKICREINKKEQKCGIFGMRSSAPKYQEKVDFAQDEHEQVWDSDEFESDDDYENPDSNDDAEGSVGDYESATEAGAESDEYESPPSEPSDDLQPTRIWPAKPMGNNSVYIDQARASVESQPPVPPARPGPGPPPGRPSVVGSYQRTEQSPQRLQKPPPPDRSKKPSPMDRRSNTAPAQGASLSAINDRTPPSRSRPGASEFVEPPRMPKPPLPAVGVRRSASSITQSHSHSRQALDPRNEIRDDNARPSSNTFPMHSRNPSPRPPPHGHSGQPESINQTASLPSRLQEAMNSHRSSSRTPPQQPVRFPDRNTGGEQDMDPAWYVGQVTRGQAENNLRVVNRDGAFLVRDSSKGSSSQPYTLMVLYQNKVFNIQIRREQNGFFLGTGLKSCEIFASVGDIIKQHTQMPLLLIDAKNRGKGQQNQCALIHPAGF